MKSEHWIAGLAVLAVVLLSTNYLTYSFWQQSAAELKESDAELREFQEEKDHGPKEDDEVCTAGFMVTTTKGQKYTSGAGGYYFIDPKTGRMGDDLVQLPWGSQIKSRVTLRRWSVDEVVYFDRGDKDRPIWVEVDFSGIETPESSIFIHEMEQKTLARHPDESWLLEGRGERLWEQWVDDEIENAVGANSGKGLSPRQIHERAFARMQALGDKYGLGTSVRGRVETHMAVGRDFYN